MSRKTWFVCLFCFALNLLMLSGASAQGLTYKARLALYEVNGKDLASMAGHIAQKSDNSLWVYIDFADTKGHKFGIRSASDVVITKTQASFTAPITYNGVQSVANVVLTKSGAGCSWSIVVKKAGADSTADPLWTKKGSLTRGSLMVLNP